MSWQALAFHCFVWKPELTANGKPAAQNRWIAYNKMRGQYSSAMEHAVPEQFWVDKSQCRYQDEQGQIQNPTQQDCAQAVSAVKAIAIAQAQGQKIYTINQSNAATALPKLPVGGTVGQEIQSAVQAGKEVTVHEKPISAHGFTGYGYTITDPETGAGAYLIEGKGNGGILLAFIAGTLSILILYFLGPFAILGWGWMLLASIAGALSAIEEMQIDWKDARKAIQDTLGLFSAIWALMLGGPPAVILMSIIGLVYSVNSFLAWFGLDFW